MKIGIILSLFVSSTVYAGGGGVPCKIRCSDGVLVPCGSICPDGTPTKVGELPVGAGRDTNLTGLLTSASTTEDFKSGDASLASHCE